MAVHANRVHSLSGAQQNRSVSAESMKVGSASCGTLRTFPPNRSSPSTYREPSSFTGRDRYPLYETSSCVDYNEVQSRQSLASQHRPANNQDSFMDASYVMPTCDYNGSCPTSGNDFGSQRCAPSAEYNCSSNEHGCRRAASFLHEMWTEQKMCDVVLRCSTFDRNEEQSLLAHKVSIILRIVRSRLIFSFFPKLIECIDQVCHGPRGDYTLESFYRLSVQARFNSRPALTKFTTTR